MTEIHKALHKQDFRFCPLQKPNIEKRKCKESFTDHNLFNYLYNDPILTNYLKQGHNVGILVGYGFDLLIDVDNPLLYEKIKHLLPKTLTTISGIKKLPHLYYKAPYLIQKWSNIKQKEFDKVCDFFSKGKYGVAPNSKVYNNHNKEDKILYEYTLEDNPIVELPEENLNQILKIVTEFYVQNKPIKPKTKPKKVNPNITWFDSQIDGKRYFNNHTEIHDIKKLYKNNQGQFIFEAFFPDQEKTKSFGLNKPTENKLLDILINGKNRAIFYTIIKDSKYMRQIKEV